MANKLLDNVLNFVWKCTHKDAAGMLIGMGALGFALSSMAQCFAIKINDKIDKRKKSFLLMQETADGIINIGLFLGITSSIWKLSDKFLVATGIGRLGNTSKQVIKPYNRGNVRCGGRILTTMIASVVSCNIITPFVRNFIAGKMIDKRDRKEFLRKGILSPAIKNNLSTKFKNFDKFSISAINHFDKNKTTIKKPNPQIPPQKPVITPYQNSGMKI